ncbi:MAG: amino acid ABC transporter substrate-binding protein [Rhodocyclales bacterium]|nr:amino acid ABC transporter substrate-binding protein [Rhodocyclales bacterium]
MTRLVRARRLICLGLLAALLPTAAAQAASRELRVATLLTAAADNPADSGEGGAIAELNEALTRELCRRLMARCSLHPQPFAEIIPGVEAGRYQLGVGNVIRSPEREARVLFSRTLWRASSRLVGTPAAIRQHRPAGGEIRVQALHGVRIAAVRGSQQHQFVARHAATRQLVLTETATLGEALHALLDGRADFALMPVRGAYFLLAQQPPGSVEFTGPPLTEEGLGGTVHLILPKAEGTLQREVDRALDAMRGDGTFQRIVRRYMPFLAD